VREEGEHALWLAVYMFPSYNQGHFVTKHSKQQFVITFSFLSIM
jgi:hypothetical protein